MPEKGKIGNFSYTSINTYGLNLGYNFKKSENDLPVSLGLGYLHNRINYGALSYDLFECFSIGASYNYYILFNIGFSVKPFDSKLGESFYADGTAFDFGTFIIAPVSELFFNDTKFQLDNNSFLKPVTDFSIGYSISNIGKEIYYVDPAQSDPLSRTARFGYTLSLGMDLVLEKSSINTVNYSFTAETEDELINSDGSYQRIFGDINIGRNLIGLKGDDKIILHRGHILRLFDTVVLASGRITVRNDINFKTDGFGVSSNGIFKLLSSSVENPVLKFIFSHLAVEYMNSDFAIDHLLKRNYKGIAVYFNNIVL